MAEGEELGSNLLPAGSVVETWAVIGPVTGQGSGPAWDQGQQLSGLPAGGLVPRPEITPPRSPFLAGTWAEDGESAKLAGEHNPARIGYV
jgi:hypothetical protein